MEKLTLNNCINLIDQIVFPLPDTFKKDLAYIQLMDDFKQNYKSDNLKQPLYTREGIKNFNWRQYLLNKSSKLQSLDLVQKLSPYILKLERHRFAPELNKLWFKNGYNVTVNGVTTVQGAKDYLISSKNPDELKKILLHAKK